MKRVPTVLQMEAAECGPACLAMILAHHGRWVPMPALRECCGVGRDGCNALRLVEAAREQGLLPEAMRLDPSQVGDLGTPWIAYWEGCHFVVVERVTGRSVRIVDPACGRRTLSREEFAASFSGVAICFQPTAQLQRTPRASLGWRRAWDRLPERWPVAWFLGLTGATTAGATLALAGGLRALIDAGTLSGEWSWAGPLALGAAVAGGVRATGAWLSEWTASRIELKLGLLDAGSLIWRALRLPVAAVRSRHPSDILTAVEAGDHAADAMARFLVHASSIVPVLILSASMVALVGWIGVGAIALGLALVAGSSWAGCRAEEALRVADHESARAWGTASASMSRGESIKASGAEGVAWSRVVATLDRARRAGSDAASWRGMIDATDLAGWFLGLTLLWGVGFLRVEAGAITPGVLASAAVLWSGAWGAACALARVAPAASRLEHLRQRTEDLRSLGHDDSRGDHHAGVTVTGMVRRLRGFVAVRGVRAGYPGSESPVLDGVELSLQPGEILGLTGRSGSGKSTLARVIAGTIEPQAGQVLLDDAPRDGIPRPLLASSLALVESRGAFAPSSVREAIGLWDATLPDQAIHRAARDAQVHAVITARRGAYAASVEPGARNFSGGQRQRLDIARALAGDPSILILDEATSALDPATEAAILEAIRRRGCACLFISHRPGALERCDRVAVLDGGRIVEMGQHGRLLRMGGIYAELVSPRSPGGRGE